MLKQFLILSVQTTFTLNFSIFVVVPNEVLMNLLPVVEKVLFSHDLHSKSRSMLLLFIL